MSQFLNFDDRRLGELAAAASFGSSLITLSAIFFIARKGWPLRRTIIITLCVYAAINLTIPTVFNQPLMLIVALFLGGCCSGMVWSTAATAITTVRNNERLISVFYGTPYLTGLVVQPLMPLVFAKWGLASAYLGIASAALLAVLAMRAFPIRTVAPSAPVEAVSPAPRRTVRAAYGIIIVLGALLLQYLANSGLWVYFDRIGHVSGHSPQASANVVAFGSAMALAGTALAVVLSTRLQPLPTIIAVNVVMGAVTLLFFGSSQYLVFGLAVGLFNLMITFVTPFFLILLTRIAAAPGRAVLGANICMYGGFALGPLLVGRMTTGGDFSNAIIATAVAFVLSALIITVGWSTRRFEVLSV